MSVSPITSNRKKPKSGVYQIFCTANGRRYVGSSTDLHARKRSHFSTLGRNKHRNRYLQNAYNKYGRKAFRFMVLEFCKAKKTLEIEQFYLDNWPCEFNIAQFADRPMLGMRHTTKARTKISVSHTGKGNPFYGKRHSEETRRRMSKSRSGENNPNYGIAISEERKRRLSEINRGKKHTQETIEKMIAKRIKPVHQIDIETGKILKTHPSINDAAKAVNGKATTITRVARGKGKTHRGFGWQYCSKDK